MIAIYTLVDPRNDEVFYVGQTINPKHRLKNHCAPGNKTIKLAEIIKSIKADGFMPEMRIAKWAESRKDAHRLEHRLIYYYLKRGTPIVNTHWALRGQ